MMRENGLPPSNLDKSYNPNLVIYGIACVFKIRIISCCTGPFDMYGRHGKDGKIKRYGYSVTRRLDTTTVCLSTVELISTQSLCIYIL